VGLGIRQRKQGEKVTIFEANRKFQKSLNYGLAVAHDAVLRAYAEAYSGLEDRLAALAAKIAQEAKPPVAWLQEKNRIEAMKLDFASEIVRVASKATKIAVETQQELIKEAKHYVAASSVAAAQASGVALNFAAVPDDQLRAYVGVTSNGSPIRDSFEELALDLGVKSGDQIDRAILRGIANGYPPKMMVREVLREAKLATGAGTDPEVAGRLYAGVHAAALNSAREATRTGYAKAGILRYRWTSSRNRRTCPVCWGLDGVIFETSEPMTPHLLCRCTLVPYLGVDLFDDTGPEAFDKLPDDDKEFILGPKSFKAYKDGKVTVSDFVGVAEDPKWGKYYTRRSLTSILGVAEAKKYGVNYPKPVIQYQKPVFAPHPKKIQPLLLPKKPPKPPPQSTGGSSGPSGVTPPPAPQAIRIPLPAAGPTPRPTPSVPRPIPHPDELRPVPGAKLGGSTGARLMEDAAGDRYVLKTGANADHLREEFMADAAYRAAGVDVPESALFETPNGPVKVARYVKGQEIWEISGDAEAFEKAKGQAKKNFALDAILANRDVPGASWDNLLVDKEGRVWRIDNGAALRFRAQGAMKHDFGAIPYDFRTMRDPIYGAGKLFHDLDLWEVSNQIIALEKKMPAVLDALTVDEVRNTVRDRYDRALVFARGVKALKRADFDAQDLEDMIRIYLVNLNKRHAPDVAFAMARHEVEEALAAVRDAKKNPLVKKWKYKPRTFRPSATNSGKFLVNTGPKPRSSRSKGRRLTNSPRSDCIRAPTTPS
jgi:SPP1 gp7 family putative phage head morphogenesis protein